MATSIIIRDQFVIESYTKDVTVSAGGYASIDETKTKSGYSPVAAVGFNTTGTNSSYAQPVKMRLYSPTTGSTGVLYGVRNQFNTACSWTLQIDVLWRKVGGG